MATDDKFTPGTASAVVIANMVGTGVFTSLGFQVVDIKSGFALIMLWVIGGVVGLCGALTYAELGAALPRSGGEYNFLSRTVHPSVGFVSGWISSTIGFAGPVALAALTFASYFSSVFPVFSPVWLATGLIVVLTFTHASNRTASAGVQKIATIVKVALILIFSGAALLSAEQYQPISFLPNMTELSTISGGAFAVALIYVSYAYAGWNAATYLSGELREPQRNLPRVLFFSTAVVVALYVLLNAVFLTVAPIEALEGRVEVGYVAAQYAFGPFGADLMGVMLSLLLISTASAMIMAGPRVLQMIGEDFRIFSIMGRTNKNGVPAIAIYLQSTLSLVFLWTGGFDSILVFTGATLALSTFATVFGLFMMRWRMPDIERPYRTWAYPLPPLVFLGIVGWTLVYTVENRPTEALISGGVVAAGFLFYGLSRFLDRKAQ